MKTRQFIVVALVMFVAFVTHDLFAQVHAAKLTTEEGQKNNAFGTAVALDGDYAVVGAFLDTNGNGDKAGAVYVYKRNGDTWTQQAKLVGSGAQAEHRFGERPAIDGEYILAANRAEDDKGAVYVFRRDGTMWTEQAKLTVDDLQNDEELGVYVVFQDPYAFIGGSSIRIFKREGEQWTYQTKLTTNNGEDLVPRSVSGDYLVASRTFLNPSSSASTSEVYIFERDGESWVQQVKLDGADAGVVEWRALVADLSGDDLAIGTRDPSSSFDSIYLFKHDQSGWTFQTSFTSEDAADVGLKISEIAVDGDAVIVGDNNQSVVGENSGAAYVFKREGNIWSELSKLVPNDGLAHDRFGISVAMYDSLLLVGQDGHQVGDTLPSGFGAAYVYTLQDIIATGVSEARIPTNHEISEPYPNPFLTQTRLTIRVEQPQHVTVDVFDLLGRRISVLHDATLTAGVAHEFVIEGSALPSGMYLIRVASLGRVATRTIHLVR